MKHDLTQKNRFLTENQCLLRAAEGPETVGTGERWTIGRDTYHAQRQFADAARERKLIQAGFKVLRLPASLVMRDLAEAVARFARAL